MTTEDRLEGRATKALGRSRRRRRWWLVAIAAGVVLAFSLMLLACSPYQ